MGFELDVSAGWIQTKAPPAPPRKPPTMPPVKLGGNGSTFGTPVSSVLDNLTAVQAFPIVGRDETVTIVAGNGAIFLHRVGEFRHWQFWSRGIKGMSEVPLDLPIPCNCKLPVAIGYLQGRWPDLLSGAWITYQLPL